MLRRYLAHGVRMELYERHVHGVYEMVFKIYNPWKILEVNVVVLLRDGCKR